MINLLILNCLVFVDFDDGFLMVFNARLSLHTGVHKSNTTMVDIAKTNREQRKAQKIFQLLSIPRPLVPETDGEISATAFGFSQKGVGCDT